MTKYYHPWYLYSVQGQQVWRVIRRKIPRTLAGGYPWMKGHEEMEGEGLLAGIHADRTMSRVSVGCQRMLGSGEGYR